VKASDICTAGSYTKTVRFKNRGNNSIQDSVVLSINVPNPEVSIISVTPERWNINEAETIIVFGNNFFTGTKLYIDDTELPILKLSRYEITASLPPRISVGTHAITVEGPDGRLGIKNIEVMIPTYNVLGYKTQGIIPKGGTGSFVYTNKTYNEYTGTAAFSISGAPSDWTISIDKSVIGVEETANLSVHVPRNATEGLYATTLLTQEDYSLTIDITVMGTIPGPHISSFSTPAAFAGDTISIFGYGFISCLDQSCPNPEVKYNDLQMNVISATCDTIIVQVPSNAENEGDVTVARDGLVSNPAKLFIKEYGYSIHTPESTVRLDSANRRTFVGWNRLFPRCKPVRNERYN
jgi:hypothetical protein